MRKTLELNELDLVEMNSDEALKVNGGSAYPPTPPNLDWWANFWYSGQLCGWICA
jgi:hypothetical protein